MKTINVRELRAEMPRLRELREHELPLVSNGEPVARIRPPLRERQLPSLAEHRVRMAMVEVPSEVLTRKDRDRR